MPPLLFDIVIEVRIYFITAPQGPATRACYDHQSVALVEGLLTKSIEVAGKRSFFPVFESTRSHLIEKEHFDFHESDVVVFSSEVFDCGCAELLPKDLYSSKRNYKLVFLDNSDGFKTPGFRPEMTNVDIVLKSHYNLKQKYPDNFMPWQYGLTNRLMKYANFDENILRLPRLLEAFRVEHGSRNLAHRFFLPLINTNIVIDQTRDDFDNYDAQLQEKQLWEITGRRHYPAFYDRLRSSLACAAFGGELEPSWIFGNLKWRRRLTKVNDFITHGRMNKRILQWDSFRFWESLICGCATIHVDLERYGALLPVMPVNYQHYIGVDFDDIGKAVLSLTDLPDVERIALNGKIWVQENYSPSAVADRFLSILEFV